MSSRKIVMKATSFRFSDWVDVVVVADARGTYLCSGHLRPYWFGIQTIEKVQLSIPKDPCMCDM